MTEENENSGVATKEFEAKFLFKKTLRESSRSAAEDRAHSLALSLNKNSAFNIIELDEVNVDEK